MMEYGAFSIFLNSHIAVITLKGGTRFEKSHSYSALRSAAAGSLCL